ncbi:mannose-1-phosphate guanylyltransferase/mannose-6-phosphate isomerase [Hafnia paralvei]|uniref:mannose-1-phosphate guanylyltransferase n=1 Tax=Hafnia alvei TaxID=569 RepID=A0A172WZR6_HAFAL|nr:mannose-1-phosphate guanylyltransferase/mannose-6-phosphate isomerase [Hafnia paralvei]ANF29864.1 mannose-1-phosphate guanylyltransferase 1 [Hafnia alvei]TBM12051.1 mannose-1-phosphate guanylyltransferase/mannose-6-phosphate isomerase [Hafnia paralvei]
MSSKIIPVILCGGNGSRLWPLSRVLYPKQFLSLQGGESMLQATILRLKNLKCENPLVICNEEHRFLVAEQLREIGKLSNNIILEPVGKNTAPAVALAALASKYTEEDGDALLLVLAADHVIDNEDAFIEALVHAVSIAENGKLITFGIVPNVAETGYGYIRRGSEFHLKNDSSKVISYSVSEFVEKPDLIKAQQYLDCGEYYWNSGMFLFRADRYIEELEKFRPDILCACEQAIAKIDKDLDFVRIDEKAFINCPDISIDYAVMENTSDAIVVPLDAGWSDVGSWSSLWDISDKDEYGNVARGDVISLRTKNSYIYAESSLIATLGVDNLVIIQTKDAVLIADRKASQEVKNIVEKLKHQGRHEHYSHREIYRPWGKYDSIDSGERYQVKRITVNPGESLSLQMHHHRSEHWVVVAGTARVLLGNKESIISENESIYIPLGVAHRLENPGRIPLDLIEVRSGSYLEEDDIIRFKDLYGRI